MSLLIDEDEEFFSENTQDLLEYNTPWYKKVNLSRITESSLIACTVCFVTCFLCFMALAIVIYEIRGDFTSSSGTVEVLVLSDIHLNLYYDGEVETDKLCMNYNQSQGEVSKKYPYGKYGCDAPVLLLNKTLERIKEKDPKHVVILGDFVGHMMRTEEEYKDTIEMCVRMIRDALPKSKIYPVIGNNDVFPDYYMPLREEVFSRIRVFFQPFQEVPESFLHGGYYYEEIDDKIGLIVLNTVLYSTRWYGSNTSEADPMGQFAFLSSILASKKAEKYQIACHIPLGVGAYSGKYDLKAEYEEKLWEILEKHHDKLLPTWMGHYHFDEWRADKNRSHSLFLHASISPIHSNNPGFRTYTFDRHNLTVVRYRQEYLNLNYFSEMEDFEELYDSMAVYGEALDERGMRRAMTALQSSGKLQNLYVFHKSLGAIANQNRALCTLTHTSLPAFHACQSIAMHPIPLEKNARLLNMSLE